MGEKTWEKNIFVRVRVCCDWELKIVRDVTGEICRVCWIICYASFIVSKSVKSPESKWVLGANLWKDECLGWNSSHNFGVESSVVLSRRSPGYVCWKQYCLSCRSMQGGYMLVTKLTNSTLDNTKLCSSSQPETVQNLYSIRPTFPSLATHYVNQR